MPADFMTYLIVIPLVFVAGLVDSIAGGGGLISLPAYMIAGLPTHQAIATNKMSATFGTTLTTVRFIRNGLVNLAIGIPSVVAAIIGSAIGAEISLRMDEGLLERIMLVILPITAIIVLNKHIFQDNGETEVKVNRRTMTTAIVAALVVGVYDGLYGPGTGTFLIIAFVVFGKLGMLPANGQTKLINCTTNWTSLVLYLISGNVLLPLGIVAAIANMVGNYLGTNLALKGGSKIVKPCILCVLGLLLLKVLGVF